MISGHMWVPIDDENCMVWNWSYSLEDTPDFTEWEHMDRTARGGPENQIGHFRSMKDIRNDWLIDREVPKNETYTWIEYINMQDQAIHESMGRIADRTKDHLTPSDLAIARLRRLLFQAASITADGGDPPSLAATYYKLSPFDRVMPADAGWRDVLLAEMLQS